MTQFTVIAYEKENGESPVEDFINGLDVKMRAKVYGLLSILQDKGNALREPYSKHLDDGIFELRCKVGSNITRVLYFFIVNDISNFPLVSCKCLGCGICGEAKRN